MVVAKSDRHQEDIHALEALDRRLRWLSSWTIHNANHLRDSATG
jgi:pyruvate dehydrogenase E1 component